MYTYWNESASQADLPERAIQIRYWWKDLNGRKKLRISHLVVVLEVDSLARNNAVRIGCKYGNFDGSCYCVQRDRISSRDAWSGQCRWLFICSTRCVHFEVDKPVTRFGHDSRRKSWRHAGNRQIRRWYMSLERARRSFMCTTERVQFTTTSQWLISKMESSKHWWALAQQQL